MADFLPAGHQVVAVLAYHTVQFGYLVRAVLKVGVHGDDHVSGGFTEAGLKGSGLAVVAAEAVGSYVRIDGRQLLYCLPGTVVASIIYHQHFIFDAGYVGLRDCAVYPLGQLA